MNDRSNKYDNVIVTLHWVIGIGILLLGGLELFRHEFPRGHLLREGLKSIHQPLGTVLFLLIGIRVIWRLFVARNPQTVASRSLTGVAATMVHLALYMLMIGLPVLGLIYVFGSGNVVDFGIFKLSLPLKSVFGDSAKSARWLHETLGVAILAVAALHAGAALFHQYVLKDQLMAKMKWRRDQEQEVLTPAE